MNSTVEEGICAVDKIAFSEATEWVVDRRMRLLEARCVVLRIVQLRYYICGM
jgi:hypothetical protein